MDQRRHPRFEGAGLQARLKVDGSVHPEAVIENVSLGGALVCVRGACDPGKNVLLELDGLKLVGRVIDTLPRGKLRIRFNPSSASCTEKLYSLLRSLPAESSISNAPTEAFEFHSIDLDLDDDEVELELTEVVEDEDDEPTVLTMMAHRIAELERELATVRRNARTLEELLLPAIVGS